MNSAWLNYLAIPILLGLIGWGVGHGRGRGGFGFIVGLLLGPIGWLIVLLLPKAGPKCPACLGVINAGASKCCHCGSDLPTSNPFASLRH